MRKAVSVQGGPSLKTWVPLVAVLFLLSAAATAGAEECSKTHVVEVTHIFLPKDITVKVGECIRFVNIHSIEHSAVGLQREFHTGTMPSGGASVIAFGTPGELPYICGLHPPMIGTITVKPK